MGGKSPPETKKVIPHQAINKPRWSEAMRVQALIVIIIFLISGVYCLDDSIPDRSQSMEEKSTEGGSMTEGMMDPVHPSGPGFIKVTDSLDRGTARFQTTTGSISLMLDVAEIRYILTDSGSSYMVRIHPVGSSDIAPTGMNPIGPSTNFLVGNEPDTWITDAGSYSTVEYKDLYPGIDLRFRAMGDQVKYDFVVHPGGDPSDIRLRVEGHQSISLSDDGDLVLSTPLGDIIDRNLVATYGDGKGEEVESTFDIIDSDVYGFAMGPYDMSRSLVLDPLIYSTLLGGSALDETAGVAVDDDGNSYIVGTTTSTDLPTEPGVLQPLKENDTDVFVAKVDPSGEALLWTTYIGGEGHDEATGVSIDPNGNPVVTGFTNSTDLPTTPGVLRRNYYGGYQDAFVLRLAANGTTLLTSTYVGGTDGERSYDITVGDDGRVYIVGETWSHDFPTPAGFQKTFLYRACFISVLSEDMAGMEYSTFLSKAGSKETVATCIAVDGKGLAYVAGYTNDGTLPVRNAQQGGMTWIGWDVFYATFDPGKTSDASLVMLSYWGSYGADYAYGIDVDDEGTYVITGKSVGEDRKGSEGSYQNVSKGGYDVFVYCYWGDRYGKYHPKGFLTYIGGSGDDEATSVGFDRKGNIHLTGTTASQDFPTTDIAWKDRYGGEGDAFYTILNSTGSHLEYSTFLGASNEDAGTDLDLNERINVTVVGTTASNAYPTTEGVFQRTHKGGIDSFVTSFAMALEPPVVVLGPDYTVSVHETVVLDGTNCTDDWGIINWTWSFYYDQSVKLLYGPAPNFTFALVGEFNITLVLIDNEYLTSRGSFIITVVDLEPPSADAGDDQEINQGDDAVLDGTRSWDNVGIVDYLWTFEYEGDVVSINGPKYILTFDEPGVYEITLKVTDTAGLNDTDVLVITVIDTEPPAPPEIPSSPIYTNHQPFSLTGNGEPWAQLEVLIGSEVVASTSIGEDGNWSVDIPLDSPETVLRARVVDGAGNVGGVSPELLIILDTDEDGYGDNVDAFPEDATEWLDSDEDGHGDNGDAFPNDPAEWLDTDGDDHGDNGDVFPDDVNEWNDTDTDGVGDNGDAFPDDVAASVDADDDGYPDEWNTGKTKDDSTTGLKLDEFPSDPKKWKKDDDSPSVGLLGVIMAIGIIAGVMRRRD